MRQVVYIRVLVWFSWLLDQVIYLNPNWHEGGNFPIIVLFGSWLELKELSNKVDQNLSAEFLSKNLKLFWRWKLTSIELIWHHDKLIHSYKKDEQFSCFHSSCQLGLSWDWDILIEKSYFAQLVTTINLSQLEINHVIHEPTA